MKSGKTRDSSIIIALRSILPDDRKADDPDAEAFANLVVRQGDNGTRPLFQPSMKSIMELIELSSMFQKWGVRETYDYLTTEIIPHLEELYISGGVEHYSSVIFSSPLLENERLNEEAVLAMNAYKGPLTNITSCKRCGEPSVHKRMAQTRSADEGTSAIFTCPRCGFGWTEG